ncbi:MAG: hypothetical protein KAG56_00675 [Sulfurovaceae bacterium]|nr:hypothetical protein [Sulfurovaceae bacterium]
MKAILVLAILLAIGLIYLTYKKEANLQKMLLSFAFLTLIIFLGIIGNMMRSITPLFLTHLTALLLAYGGLIFYVLRNKFYWYLGILPVATLALYLLLSWLGNEHI